LLVSSLLNIAYMLVIPIRGFFLSPAGESGTDGGISEAPKACLLAMGITSAACIVLFIYPDYLYQLVAAITE